MQAFPDGWYPSVQGYDLLFKKNKLVSLKYKGQEFRPGSPCLSAKERHGTRVHNGTWGIIVGLSRQEGKKNPIKVWFTWDSKPRMVSPEEITLTPL